MFETPVLRASTVRPAKRCREWNRHPEILGYGSPGKSLETEGSPEIRRRTRRISRDDTSGTSEQVTTSKGRSTISIAQSSGIRLRAGVQRPGRRVCPAGRLGIWSARAQGRAPASEGAAVRALQLDIRLGEAHTSLAFCLDAFDWDLKSADTEFRRGIDLYPGDATPHHWYAWHLSLLRRNSDAIAELKKAQTLDPLSLIINADLAELLLIAHFTTESIQQSRKTIEMDVTFPLAHNQLAVAYLQGQKHAEAIAELQAAVRLSAGSPTCIANLARAFALSGRRNEAVQLSSPEGSGQSARVADPGRLDDPPSPFTVLRPREVRLIRTLPPSRPAPSPQRGTSNRVAPCCSGSPNSKGKPIGGLRQPT
jgi:Flp pilus assembly protein TadD